ncbi:MAG TPA: tetratricopeptide repeat protein [Chitinophagaceae bacterium]|nr:tetratricopeptide repeat protein [Chitinophagaceae bacterium]
MKLVKLLFLLLFLCRAKPGFSQADSIIAIPEEQQVLALLKWYYHDLTKKEPELVNAALTNAENLFSERNNMLLQRQAWLLLQFYNAGKKGTAEKAAAAMLDAANEAGKKHWPIVRAECWHFAGSFYFAENMYVPAFEYMLKAQNVFDEYDPVKYPYLLRYADGLAGCYYRFGEYGEAIKYLKKTTLLPSWWSSLIYFPSINNTIALCYQHLKQYDSAAKWYRRSYNGAAAVKDSFYMALANGNLGFTYYSQQKYDEALPLVEADYIASIRAGETGSAVNAAMTLTAIYIRKGQLALAQKYMDLARQSVYTFRDVTQLRSWYENLYQISKANGDNKNIGLYADSLLFYKDSVTKLNDKRAYNQAVLKIETEKHLNEVSQLESKRKEQIILRNSLLIGLILLAMISFLWVNRQLLKRNKEKELAQQQLHFAKQELISYTQQLKEKTEVLEQLRDEINRENISQERTEHINSLLGATILTEDDWKKFRQLFEKVYPGFFIHLKERIPDLSATDTRLLALTKLKLPLKDMASMLGVTYDAVKKAKQRLRKKINLPDEQDLEDVVELI